MNTDYQNKTIALAGIHQALMLVQDIAWDARYDYQHMDISISSLFVRNPNNFTEVFGTNKNIQSGLQALRASFKNKHDKLALERARYMVGLMIISKKIRDNSELTQQIGTTLSLLDEAAENLSDQRDYIIERIAQLYQNTISQISPRNIVYGKPEVLNKEDNAAAIRTLLFAGLRASLLWYQAGGSQVNLLFGKSKYLKTIDQMLG